MQHSRPGQFRYSLRLLALQWLAVAVLLPPAVIGIAHRTHLTASEVWQAVIVPYRVGLLLLVAALNAFYPWVLVSMYRYSGTPAKDRAA
jgi:hypothetical protein